MANTTGGDKVFQTPWTTDRSLMMGNETLGASTTYYGGQAIGRDASGLLVQMDDTAKAEFIGLLDELVRWTVGTATNAGDDSFTVDQPQMFLAKIASAAAGDEGKRVYWLYNNQVAYTPGSYGNYAGTVWEVFDSTHVVVVPPWLNHITNGRFRMLKDLGAGSGTVTLTKWDVNNVFTLNLTAATQVNLPVAVKCSPGDEIDFIKIDTSTFTLSVLPQGSDSINSVSTTFNNDTVQFNLLRAVTDGVANWYAKKAV